MKRFLSILAVAVTLSLVAIPAFSQENKETAPAPTPTPPATEAVLQPEEISIYGEVKSIDGAANSVKLQYYDYDNDEEKAADIVLDKDTKMENAAVIQDIKQGDWVDAVYVIKDGKNIAKSVIVEKEEEAPAPVMPEEKKAETQPAEKSATE